MLKIVRVPSSWRVGITWAIAGWCIGAIMNAIPASSSARSTTSGPTITFTPIWVRASAAPDLDDRLRLPCLATTTPAPATTKAVAVEMLSVPLPSPPVPTISIAPSGACTRLHLSRITEAAAAYSSTVSPRVRRVISKPPIWLGVASPSNRISNAASASARLSGRSTAAAMRGLIASLMRAPFCGSRPGAESSSASRGRVRSGSIPGGTARPRSGAACGAAP